MTGFFKYFGLCAIFSAVYVTGMDFTISRDKVVVGSTGTLTMTCDVTENDVETIYLIQIRRESMPGSNNFETLVQMERGDATTETPTLQVTNNNKDFVAGGTYDGSNTDLSVSMNISKLQCNDARAYKCVLSYKSTTTDSIMSVTKNGTFSAYVYPEIQQLEGKKNGVIVQGSSPSDQAAFDIGNVLELSCTANIGSLQATTIRWRKTSEIGQTDEFIGYQPQAGFDEGTAISDNQCGYTRIATITYNTTVADANRDNNLAFECYVSVSGSPYGTTYTTQNNPKFYADVNGGDETPSTGTATAGSGKAGVIAGSVVGGLVLIVIIVLLVYFLWYRRRNSGEDYATKEEYGSENPNMAPPVDTYASVDKHRNRGHENRGLDEPHETRRHNYENGPGKSNYAMDRDADDYDYHSRDGSPTRSNQGINHMGMDPHGRIGTGV